MNTNQKYLRIESATDEISVVQIDRPQTLNALDSETLNQLNDYVFEAESQGRIRVVIFTGGGDGVFVSGADISEMSAMGPQEASSYSRLGQSVFQRLVESTVVTIAAINGHALGGGLEFALACDLRIASEAASFGVPEVTLGAVCGFGGTQRLPRTIGVSKAAEMLLTGRRVSAEEALSWGIVSNVVTDTELLPAAIQLAQDVVSCAPMAVQLTKRLLHQSLQSTIDSGLALEQYASVSSSRPIRRKRGCAPSWRRGHHGSNRCPGRSSISAYILRSLRDSRRSSCTGSME